MTTIIRTNAAISQERAEYLVPILPITPSGRWVASTVSDVSVIPDATGLSGPARTRSTSNSVIVDSPTKALKVLGGYDTGLYVVPTVSPKAPFSVAMVLESPTPSTPILNIGNYRVGIDSQGLYVVRDTVSKQVPVAWAGRTVVVLRLSGSDSAVWVDGVKVALDMGGATVGQTPTSFGRNSYHTAGVVWHDFAFWSEAFSDAQAVSTGDALRKAYPKI